MFTQKVNLTLPFRNCFAIFGRNRELSLKGTQLIIERSFSPLFNSKNTFSSLVCLTCHELSSIFTPKTQRWAPGKSTRRCCLPRPNSFPHLLFDRYIKQNGNEWRRQPRKVINIFAPSELFWNKIPRFFILSNAREDHFNLNQQRSHRTNKISGKELNIWEALMLTEGTEWPSICRCTQKK